MKKAKILTNHTIIYIMNLWARILGLTLLSVILLSGCEREDLKIGLPPKDNIFDLKYFEYALSPYNTLEDGITNMGSGRLLVGNYDDEFLGTISTKAYMSIVPEQPTAPTIEEGVNADSLILSLKIDYAISSTEDFQVNFNIYEPLFLLTPVNVYETNASLTVDDWVADSFFTFPKEDFEENGSVILAVPLSTIYADVLLDSLRNSNRLFQTEDDFKELIPGFAFVPKAGTTGIIGIDIRAVETKLTLYWQESEGTKEWNMTISPVEHFNYISPNKDERDFTGTPLEGLTEPHTEFASADEFIYYQSGTGLGITADAVALTALADTLENAIISTAIFEIEGVENSYFQPVPEFLRMYLTDDTNDRVFYNDQILRVIYQTSRSDIDAISVPSFSSNEQILVYNPELNKYQGDITMYIQSYLEGRADLTKFWIYDVNVPSNVSRFRTLKENVKIKVYYTKASN